MSHTRGTTARARLWGGLIALVTLAASLAACGKTSYEIAVVSSGGTDAGDATGGAGASGVSSSGADDARASVGGTPDVGKCETSLAPARIGWLAGVQWANAVRDVFGVTFDDPATLFPLESVFEWDLDTAWGTSTGPVDLTGYQHAADAVAARLNPCGATAPNAACVETFLRSKLPRAWRRPVTDAEVASLVAVFNQGAQFQPAYGVKVLTRGMLLSGSFLFRTELGADATGATGSTTLSPYELASAVSFTFLNSVPDDELWAKAADGSLMKPEVLSAQADRLLGIKATQDNLRREVSYFLHLDSLLYSPSDVPVAVHASLYESGQRFLDQVLWHGHFSDLFTSHQVFADSTLAQFYGLPAVAGDTFAALDVTDGTRNVGLLSQPSFLVANDPIVHRGLAIYTSFVCGPTIGTPPADEPSVDSQIMATSQDDRFHQIDKLSSCSSCHSLFDPLAYALESYDKSGRFQVNDPITNAPINTSTVVKGIGPDFDGPVANAADLAARLSKGRGASDCVARNLTATIVGGPPNPNDACLQAIENELASSNTFPAFFRALVTSPAFLTRDVGH